jgi:hypothetical protein
MGASIFLAPFLAPAIAIDAAVENARARQPIYAYVLRECLEPAVLEQTLGPDHPKVAQSLHGLAVRLTTSGVKSATIAEQLRQALASQPLPSGDCRGFSARCSADPAEITSREAMNRHMNRYAVLGVKYMSEADSLYRRVIRIRERALGPEHVDVAETLEDHAGLLQRMNRGAEADELKARAEAIRSKLRGRDQSDVQADTLLD